MRNSAGVSSKADDAYPTGAPGPCSQFLVEFICFCCFVCVILVTICSLLCMSVFHVWSLSLDDIIMITAIILVPLITLSIPQKHAVLSCIRVFCIKNYRGKIQNLRFFSDIVFDYFHFTNRLRDVTSQPIIVAHKGAGN